jgi:predicted MFS family arabinose efflux permease
MSQNSVKIWVPILIVFLAGSIATALVPQTVPILGAIAKAFSVDGARLGWIVSFPTLACAVGALAFGVVVDRVGDVRLLLTGIVLVIVGDAGVSLAPELSWLYAARLFQGFGYVSISVAAPTFIQRTTTGDLRRAAMAFWAAHTPVGFAAAVFVGAQFLAAGFSWRVTFLPHAAAALLVGIAALALGRAPTAANVSRSAGTWRVLTSARAYAVAVGSLAAANFQVGVMVMLPTLLADGHAFTGQQSALVIVFAMLANWAGAMVIVATRLRNIPTIALPIAAVSAAFFGYATVAGLATDLSVKLAFVMAFAATIGTANSLVWSLLPAAVPSPEAAGATAGLMTQATFLGVLVGPPAFFWIRHESPLLIAALALILAVLMMVPLFAHGLAERSRVGNSLRAADSH